MPTPPALTRRTALGALVALGGAVVAGCTATGDDHPASAQRAPAPARRSGVNPDVTLAAAVLHDERTMLDRLVATVHAHPTLAGPLAGARAAHRAHVALLTKAVPDDEPSAPASGGHAPTRPHRPKVPPKPVPALAALAQAEQRLSRVGGRNSLAAQSGAFARVLASMAAAAAQQSVHLTAVAQERR